MKHTGKRKFIRILATLLLLSILSQNKLVVYAEAEKQSETLSTKEQVIIHENDTTNEYETLPTNIHYLGISYDCSIPVVKINDVWMIPAENVFSDILNCYYQYSEKDNSILIKSPDREYTVNFTINSNIALVNDKEITMPYAVVLGTQKTTNQCDYMLPLDFIITQLGYTYTIQEQLGQDGIAQSYSLQITSNYLFTIAAKDISYDTEKYNNALAGVTIRKNDAGSQNNIQGVTLYNISTENVVVSQDAKNYSVTLQFLKTYNPFGDMTKSLKNGITKSIKIWETQDFTTCIQITYNPKQIYSQKITENGGMITLSKGNFSMRAALPDGVSFSKITTTDRYWNQRFFIIIPGNHVSFYKNYAPFDNSSYITGITVSQTSDGNTKLVVKTKGLKGYKLTKGEGSFTVQVGEPKDIYQNIVLLDAGHGGKDAGAVKNGLKEKNLNLSIIYKQMKQYFESNNSKVKAYWTRHDDTFINLYTRPTYSAKYQADLFVSLHMNSASSSSANGTEVYYSKLNNSKDFSGITSKLFAQKMQSTLINTLNTNNRGVKQAGFVVIKNNTVPSILIELGFVSGSSDSKKLKKTSFQKKAAKTIYQGICDTFESYPTIR